MAQDFELSDYANMQYELQGTQTSSTEHGGATPTERRLFRIGILTLAVLCIVQATLNISLGLAFYSKEDTDQFPYNSSIIAEVCQIDQTQQNSTQSCSCYKNLLRRLYTEYQALEIERDILRNKVLQHTGECEYCQESGSGSLEEFR